MVIDVHTSDARTIENEKVSGYDILAPSRHHHMNETEALAPSLPETGALAPSLPETGTLALSLMDYCAFLTKNNHHEDRTNDHWNH